MAKGGSKGRTYTRDARGRFASTGTSSAGRRPAPRPAPQGPNRLTRDNAGRIRSVGGDGATARGGRLRTASGKLRATQTARIKEGGGKVRKPLGGGGKASTRASSSGQAGATMPQPVRVRGNFRPRGVMARIVKGENPYNRFSGHNDENIAVAQRWLEKRGHNVTVYNDPTDRATARGSLGAKNIYLNAARKDYWSNPRLRGIESRGSGVSSSSHPLALLYHEMGHNFDTGGAAMLYKEKGRRWAKGIVPYSEWSAAAEGAGKRQTPLGKIKRGKRIAQAAQRVSRYATTNPVEFVAETYAGLRTGRRYDSQVMSAYRLTRGLPKLRTGSRVATGASPLVSPQAVARDRARRRQKPR